MLLRYSLRLNTEAQALENAVDHAINEGALTADLAAPGKGITTRAAADAVLAAL
jgi:3-isopropylmalate dehydrogenase